MIVNKQDITGVIEQNPVAPRLRSILKRYTKRYISRPLLTMLIM